jgi:hypothetical protein
LRRTIIDDVPEMGVECIASDTGDQRIVARPPLPHYRLIERPRFEEHVRPDGSPNLTSNEGDA